MKTNLSIFLSLIILILSCTSDPQKKSNLAQQKKPTTDSITTSKTDIKPQVFKYFKTDMVKLKGQAVINKQTKEGNGRIEFTEKEIKIYKGNSFERFVVKNIIRKPDGYQIETLNNKNDKCTIGVLQSKGNNLVTAHFINMEMIAMFYINEGFSLDLKMFNN